MKPKGNAHLLNASVAKRMRELRLDVAGRLYTQGLAPYQKLPHATELGIHARNALRAAEVLLKVEHDRELPGEALESAVREVVAHWSLLRDELAKFAIMGGPVGDGAHAVSNAIQALVLATRSKPE